MTTATAPSPFAVAADIFDPPAWEAKGRPKLEPHQQPPEGDWDLWLLEAGRGSGKTEACARYFAKTMRQNRGWRGLIIAPTYGDAIEACIEGPSGLLAMDPDVRWVPSAKGGGKVYWPNGSVALVLGTPQPRDVDRLRAAGNRHIVWWEEMAANPQLGPTGHRQEGAWDIAAFGLRLGDYPHAIASTTPRNTTAYRKVRNQSGVAKVRASLFDNPHNPKHFVDLMRTKYEGTRLGRQELHGELLDDIEGALWTRKAVEACRVEAVPDLVLVKTAVDPAATSSVTADDTGIIVGGLGVDGDVYILADRTCHLSPDGWGHRVVRSFKAYDCDSVLGEVNNGGEMVEHVISTVDPDVPFEPVRASRGKQTRAQPVAALYGDGKKRKSRVHHVMSGDKDADFSVLEDQMCTWVPGDEDSPDNMDALVWLVTDLLLGEEEEETFVEDYEPVKIGAQV